MTPHRVFARGTNESLLLQHMGVDVSATRSGLRVGTLHHRPQVCDYREVDGSDACPWEPKPHPDRPGLRPRGARLWGHHTHA